MNESQSSGSVSLRRARACRAGLLWSGSLALASYVGGCQTQPDRDLGDAVDDRSLDLRPPAGAAEPTEPFGVPASDFVGRWVGTAEEPLALSGGQRAYTFPSGSRLFVLELSLAEGTLLQGTITFGNGSPPPPLDPSVGYPSDVDYSQLAYFARDAVAAATYFGPLPPYEGYSYVAYETLADFEVDAAGNRLLADGIMKIGFDTTEYLYPWCELQEPRDNGGGYFDCVGGGALADGEGSCFVTHDVTEEEAAAGIFDHEPIDCNRLFLCASARCQCTEDGCLYNANGANLSHGELALRRDGNTLTGIFSNAAFSNARQLPAPLGTVRLTRVID